jgi:hypothetical protein
MSDFILDKIPKFSDAMTTIEGTTYSLRMVKNNGCVLTVEDGTHARDQIALTRIDMKALYLFNQPKQKIKTKL